MAQTPTSIDDALAKVPDNNTGSVSPRDHRDTIVSLCRALGGIYVSGGSTAQTGITSTPSKFTGFTANSDYYATHITPDYTNNRITVLFDGLYLVCRVAIPGVRCAPPGAIRSLLTAESRIVPRSVRGYRRFVRCGGV